MRNILPGKALAIGILLLAVQLPAATFYSERIDKLLGLSGQPQKTLTIQEAISGDEEEEEEKNNPLRVRFRPDMNNVEVVHSIVYALIMRREMELPKEEDEEEPQPSLWNRKRETPAANWLAAGITHRILVEEMGGVGLGRRDRRRIPPAV